MLKHLGFIVSSLWTMTWQSFIYRITGNQYRFIKNLADKLVNRNIFYVKAFQALSANTHALESDSSQYLSSFADNVDYTEDQIDDEVIESLEKQGIEFDDRHPCNAGMVSLVYSAKLSTGERVAIKIRRKGIEAQLKSCLEEMGALVDVLVMLPHFRRLNLEDMFKENKQLMLDQLDYKNELKNMELLIGLNKRIRYVRIPNVYPEYTTSIQDRVIVMEYLEGRKMNKLDINERDAYSSIIAKFGIKCLLFDGVYHGDLHQGNILFMGDKEKPVIGILDLGIIGKLTREEQNNFYNFFSSLIRRNYSSAADAIVSALAEPSFVVESLPPQCKHNLTTHIQDEARKMIEVTKECGMKEVNNLNKELGVYGLHLSRSFCKVQLSLAMAEGVNRGLQVEKTHIEQIEAACKVMFPDALSDFIV